MNRAVFPLRMPATLKAAISDRAKVENRTQTDLIREAVQQYLLTPKNRQHKITRDFMKGHSHGKYILNNQIRKVI